MASPPPEAATVGGMAAHERLSFEVALIAGHLSALLHTLSDAGLAQALGFLDDAYAIHAAGRSLEDWPGPRSRRPEGEPHPLDRLIEALGLGDAEAEILLLAGMSEESEGLAAILRMLHPRGEALAPLGLAAQLSASRGIPRHEFRRLIEEGPLVAGGAVEVVGDGAFYERSVRVAEGLWSVLCGLEASPPGVERIAERPVTVGLDGWLGESSTRRALHALARREPCSIWVQAESARVAFRRGLVLAAAAGRRPNGLRVRCGVPPLEIRRLSAYALARDEVPVLELVVGEGGRPEAPSLRNHPDTVIHCARVGETSIPPGRPVVAVPIEPLSVPARRALWRGALPELAHEAEFLAARYPVEPAVAIEIAADLRAGRDPDGPSLRAEDVGDALRARNTLALASGVRLVRPRLGWDALVLPPARLAQLQEVVERLRRPDIVLDDWGFLRDRRGARGVRVLVSGPPGTGKSLLAEVLAHSLRVDLLVVDLARIVSKWIGETEKNLAAVFDAAEATQSVLLFDEADALFAARTEVSDAHDRYANLETAYLLARLESFEGLVILSTNMRSQMDPAVIRRLEFIVDLEEPDESSRHLLWKAHMPKDAPLAPCVDVEELAALYPVVGGYVRNAATAAAFLAASADEPIRQLHLVHALRREYEKAGRAFPGPPPELAPTGEE